jgi:hypothetical protein
MVAIYGGKCKQTVIDMDTSDILRLCFLLIVIIVNLAGILIAIEQPVWAFKTQKKIRSAIGLDKEKPISPFLKFLIFILALLVLIASDGYIIIIFIGIAAVPYTFLSLLKVINALIPPQLKQYSIATILDFYTYEVSGEMSSQKFAVYMVTIRDFGVRILPPCKVHDMVRIRPKSGVSVFYRVGGLGFIYRFRFDE